VGCNFIDFDNAGKLDIFIANGDAFRMVGWQSLLLENDGQGNFRNAVTRGAPIFERPSGRARVSCWITTTMAALTAGGLMGDRRFSCTIAITPATTGSPWRSAEQEQPGRLGSLIEVTAGGKTYVQESTCPSGFLSQGDPRVHFGLGQAPVVQKIEIKWRAARSKR